MKIYTSILIGLLLIASNTHPTNTVVTEKMRKIVL
jgi:hypothetical protein